MFKDLEDAWKEVFKLAWESYKRDTIPIGAVIVDSMNEIVSIGRNRTYDELSSHILAGTCMGHAEMTAMMKIKKYEHPEINTYKMYVGLEPCPMCFGTMAMVGIKELHYAASDGNAGAVGMKDTVDYIKSMDIKTIKEYGEVEVFQVILQSARGRFNPLKKILDTWRSECIGAVELGQKLYDERYFENAINENKKISEIFDEVINKYNHEYGCNS